MKLTAINVYNVDLPVVGSYRMATTSVSFLQSTVVELVTDNGITGFGETCPVGPVYQPQHMLATTVRGCCWSSGSTRLVPGSSAP
ncbi:L-alanine-DL-glutamate epimerase-like enolase superfamily enzyme [Sinorhizobium fredii]